MTKQLIFFYGLLIISVTLISCSIQNRTTKSSIQKTIKAKSEKEKGDIIFENEYAKIYFDKNETLKTLKKMNSYKWTTPCDKKRLDAYLTNIEKSNNEITIFKELSNPSKTDNKFEIDLQRRLIERLLLKNDFVIFDKITHKYDHAVIFKKQGNSYGCCSGGFSFSTGGNFLDTRIWSDMVIIEDCKILP